MLLIRLLKNFQNFYENKKKKSSADSTDNVLAIVCVSWYDVFDVFLGLNQLAPLKQSIYKRRARIVVKISPHHFQSIEINFCPPIH